MSLPSVRIALSEVLLVVSGFLEEQGFIGALRSLEQESGVMLPQRNADLAFLRELILDGGWDDLELLFCSLSGSSSNSSDSASTSALSSPHFNLSGCLFNLRRQRFLEVFSAINGKVGAVSGSSVSGVGGDDDESIALLLVEQLRTIEALSDRASFQALCDILTLPHVNSHPSFAHWTIATGRQSVFRFIEAAYTVAESAGKGERPSSAVAIKVPPKGQLLRLFAQSAGAQALKLLVKDARYAKFLLAREVDEGGDEDGGAGGGEEGDERDGATAAIGHLSSSHLLEMDGRGVANSLVWIDNQDDAARKTALKEASSTVASPSLSSLSAATVAKVVLFEPGTCKTVGGGVKIPSIAEIEESAPSSSSSSHHTFFSSSSTATERVLYRAASHWCNPSLQVQALPYSLPITDGGTAAGIHTVEGVQNECFLRHPPSSSSSSSSYFSPPSEHSKMKTSGLGGGDGDTPATVQDFVERNISKVTTPTSPLVARAISASKAVAAAALSAAVSSASPRNVGASLEDGVTRNHAALVFSPPGKKQKRHISAALQPASLSPSSSSSSSPVSAATAAVHRGGQGRVDGRSGGSSNLQFPPPPSPIHAFSPSPNQHQQPQFTINSPAPLAQWNLSSSSSSSSYTTTYGLPPTLKAAEILGRSASNLESSLITHQQQQQQQQQQHYRQYRNATTKGSSFTSSSSSSSFLRQSSSSGLNLTLNRLREEQTALLAAPPSSVEGGSASRLSSTFRNLRYHETTAAFSSPSSSPSAPFSTSVGEDGLYASGLLVGAEGVGGYDDDDGEGKEGTHEETGLNVEEEGEEEEEEEELVEGSYFPVNKFSVSGGSNESSSRLMEAALRGIAAKSSLASTAATVTKLASIVASSTSPLPSSLASDAPPPHPALAWSVAFKRSDNSAETPKHSAQIRLVGNGGRIDQSNDGKGTATNAPPLQAAAAARLKRFRQKGARVGSSSKESEGSSMALSSSPRPTSRSDAALSGEASELQVSSPPNSTTNSFPAPTSAHSSAPAPAPATAHASPKSERKTKSVESEELAAHSTSITAPASFSSTTTKAATFATSPLIMTQQTPSVRASEALAVSNPTATPTISSPARISSSIFTGAVTPSFANSASSSSSGTPASLSSSGASDPLRPRWLIHTLQKSGCTSEEAAACLSIPLSKLPTTFSCLPLCLYQDAQPIRSVLFQPSGGESSPKAARVSLDRMGGQGRLLIGTNGRALHLVDISPRALASFKRDAAPSSPTSVETPSSSASILTPLKPYHTINNHHKGSVYCSSWSTALAADSGSSFLRHLYPSSSTVPSRVSFIATGSNDTTVKIVSYATSATGSGGGGGGGRGGFSREGERKGGDSSDRDDENEEEEEDGVSYSLPTMNPFLTIQTDASTIRDVHWLSQTSFQTSTTPTPPLLAVVGGGDFGVRLYDPLAATAGGTSSNSSSSGSAGASLAVPRSKFLGHKDIVNVVRDWDPAAPGGGGFMTGSSDGTIRLWDQRSPKCTAVIDTKQLGSGRGDGGIHGIDAGTFDVQSLSPMIPNSNSIINGNRFVAVGSSSGSVCVLEIHAGKVRLVAQGKLHPSEVRSIDCLGPLILSGGSSGHVNIAAVTAVGAETEALTTLARAAGHSDRLLCAKWDKSGEGGGAAPYFATSSADKRALLWTVIG